MELSQKIKKIREEASFSNLNPMMSNRAFELSDKFYRGSELTESEIGDVDLMLTKAEETRRRNVEYTKNNPLFRKGF